MACASHARQLARAYDELVRLGADVFIIGAGGPADAAVYRRRHQLPFRVLADESGEVYARFAVGRWLLGLLRQSSVAVIARSGQIVYSRTVDNPRDVVDIAAITAAVTDWPTLG